MTKYIFIALFLSCTTTPNNKSKNLEVLQIEKTDSLSLNTISEVNQEYLIDVEKIDSIHFLTFKLNSAQKKQNIVKITNFNEAKKRLKGIVEFDEKDIEYPLITKIYFRNNKVPNVKEYELDDCVFKAYYPEEDVLLCEGGHGIDISYNLKNAIQTEDVGNPEIIVTSPKNEFRLNGYFGGQECYSYFIQRKVNNEYKKIIQLDETFELLTKHWLCTIGDSFWIDENTLFLTETDFAENGITTQYFKVKIIKQ